MRKRLLALFLASAMLVSFVGCGKSGNDESKSPAPTTTAGSDKSGETTKGAEDTTAANKETTKGDEAKLPTEASGQLIVGVATEPTGDWGQFWSNNGTDITISSLIDSMGTMGFTKKQAYVPNMSVLAEKPVKTENADKSKTTTFKIKKDLKFSNGDPITAKDFVFGVLYGGSAALGELKGYNSGGYQYVGFDDYNAAKVDYFSGVRLLDDYTFSITVDKSQLPNFFEDSMFATSPVSIKFYLGDGYDVKDDGKGAYICDASGQPLVTNHKLVEAMKARLDAVRYESENRVSSGPYLMKSFDKGNNLITLSVNPNYPGNWEGQKPLIKTLIFKHVTQNTMIDDLKTGGVDFLDSLADGAKISAGLDLVETGKFQKNRHDRAGYGKIMFACDFGPTQYKEVRHAIAHLLNRKEFAQTFTGGYGSLVNGPYGPGQWMAEDAADQLEALNPYEYSLDAAVKQLEKAGFTLDAQGNAYSGEGIRYRKMEDGKLMPLIIKWAGTVPNSVTELLKTMLQENPDVAKAGMKIELDTMDFPNLQKWLGRSGDKDSKYATPTYNMFNLATNFYFNSDYTKTYSNDPKVMGTYNTNFIKDAKLAELAHAMILVEPGDTDTYLAKWVEFVKYWNEVLPDLPLYSNQYHDFFKSSLKNYHADSIWSFSDAILYAYIQE